MYEGVLLYHEHHKKKTKSLQCFGVANDQAVEKVLAGALRRDMALKGSYKCVFLGQSDQNLLNSIETYTLVVSIL
ncbi:hypothetical protein HanIR_Chr12g0578761 [Helianthus annuus]|nr:hypothetical protein HanIR_Chr12g0578761 [Helianthus annuus]